MKDKIYVVVSEWQSADGSFDTDVIGVFYDPQQATECFRKERDTVLEESYETTFEQCEECEDVRVKSSDNYFFIAEEFGNRWDSITIHEKEIEQRDFIAIQFVYDGETFNERVYLDSIDYNHYENLFDWWFGAPKDSRHPDLCFELNCDMDENGNYKLYDMRIAVYENEDADEPTEWIDHWQIKAETSWIGRKDGFII